MYPINAVDRKVCCEEMYLQKCCDGSPEWLHLMRNFRQTAVKRRNRNVYLQWNLISIEKKYYEVKGKGKGKAMPVKALRGPEGSSRLRLPDFKTIDTWRQ